MKTSWAGRLRARLFPSIEAAPNSAGRPVYERFAIPYSFKPSLSVGEAVVAAGAAFLRIFLSSLLFAFWGAYSLAAVLRMQSWFWRVLAGAFLIALFLVLLTLLLLAISALARKIRFGRPPRA
jgi:hypothetical protein